VGRQDIINRLEHILLGSSRPPTLLLHGPRRMGKTSSTSFPGASRPRSHQSDSTSSLALPWKARSVSSRDYRRRSAKHCGCDASRSSGSTNRISRRDPSWPSTTG
jgi:hypothetical protein